MGLLLRNQVTPLIAAGQEALAVRSQSPNMPVRVRRVSPLREGPRVQRRGLYLGIAPDGQPVYLSYKHLRTHLHIIGPTGQDKSRLVLFIL